MQTFTIRFYHPATGDSRKAVSAANAAEAESKLLAAFRFASIKSIS